MRAIRRGASLKRHEVSFYRFFSNFKVRIDVVCPLFFDLIMAAFQPEAVLLAVDDTLCPKWGHKILCTGSFFDPVARPRQGYIWGHNWVVLCVVVEISGVNVALPFCVALYRPKNQCGRGEFRTRLEIVAEALQSVKSRTSLPISLVADGAYNNASMLRPRAAPHIPLVSLLRSDARLRADPPSRRRRRGRPVKFGSVLPSIAKIRRSHPGWTKLKVHIYRHDVELEAKTFEAWLPKAGTKLKVVLTRDLSASHKAADLSTTQLDQSPQTVIETFAPRWAIEQLFADAKQAVGLDSAEVGSVKSMNRHAALAFTYVTQVRVWACRGMKHRKTPPVSFAGQLATLREGIVLETIFSPDLSAQRPRRNARRLRNLLVAKVPA